MNTNIKIMIIGGLIGMIFALLGYPIIDTKGQFSWRNFFLVGVSSVTASLIFQMLMPDSVQ